MIGKLQSIVIDAPNIDALARFYQELAGWDRTYDGSDWITLQSPDGWRVDFQLAPDHVPPRWPDQAHPQQAHLDLRVPDLDAAAQRATTLGATPLATSETWHTLADPAGHPFDLCLKADNPGTTLMGVTIDCPDAAALSGFYAELLGKPVTYSADGMAMIGNEGEHPVLFQQVEGYTAPQWPNPEHPQQFHFDVVVDDLDAGEDAVLKLGGKKLPGGADTFRVYADPVDKPFCLVTQ